MTNWNVARGYSYVCIRCSDAISHRFCLTFFISIEKLFTRTQYPDSHDGCYHGCYMCVPYLWVVENHGRLVLSSKRKQKYQNGNIHRKLRVPTSEREGKLSNPRARAARAPCREKITEIYGNPRARAAVPKSEREGKPARAPRARHALILPRPKIQYTHLCTHALYLGTYNYPLLCAPAARNRVVQL